MTSYIFFDLYHGGVKVALFNQDKVYGTAMGAKQAIFLSAK